MEKVRKIGVLGSGSWGTAMIKMLTENSNNILWYVRDNIQAEQIIKTKRNPKYLKELEINVDKVFIYIIKLLSPEKNFLGYLFFI